MSLSMVGRSGWVTSPYVWGPWLNVQLECVKMKNGEPTDDELNG